MAQEHTFYPSRRSGFLFHTLGMSLLLMAGAYGLWRVARVDTISALLVSLVPAAAAVVGVPWLAYRLYSLLGAEYAVERDGIRLRWGLRVEHLPADQIEYVGRAEGWKSPLPRPLTAWPGSVLGIRRLRDGRSLEYMAARTRDLIVIAATDRVFAISPADPGDFELTYRRLTEMGSLSPIPAHSITPVFLLSGFRFDWAARILLLGSGLLWLILVVLVAGGIPGRDQVILRFTAQGEAAEFAPAVRLFLLPILNALFLLLDSMLGLVFYRREELRPLSYLLWLSGLVTTGLFLAAVVAILNAG